MKNDPGSLSKQFAGELYYDDSPLHQAQLRAYSNDASVYEERPLAVALPKTGDDIGLLIRYANENQVSLIPRAAGTSLAGQVVGNGLVIDLSRHFTRIVEVNTAEKWVRVQPGVIRDDLNKYLRDFGLMFGPETSTSNRAMIGGMLGNNSCGLHSIVWGSVRDHILEAKVFLHDGSIVLVNTQSSDFNVDSGNHLLENIKAGLFKLLSDSANRSIIADGFPKKSVVRRNTGYALDALLNLQPFNENGDPFNLCKLLAGSEGTIAIATELKLQLLPLPPQSTALVCVHCSNLREALLANTLALELKPMASELVDKCIMDFTIGHPTYEKNRFFISGDPEAILMVEFMADSREEVTGKANQLITHLQQDGFGYAFPVLYDADTQAAWDIRKSGLGLLRNTAGNLQPVNLIEDCAVDPHDLPAYVEDLQEILKRYKVNASIYAHAGAGELHVEPMLDLKSKEGVLIFRSILKDTATLVKKYNGSLSGEHGDGRLRGEFIATVMGEKVMKLFEEVKNIFDPQKIFNAGKIVYTPPMDTQLRMRQEVTLQQHQTFFNFSEAGGMLALAEKCSGSGDCRRSAVSSGMMCPSYMATRNEFDTTRARANLLRQLLSNPAQADPLSRQEIKEVMDLCLSCKACKAECPSGVDITKLKAEFLQHYYDKHGIPRRVKLIGHFSNQMRLASLAPNLYNLVAGSAFSRRIVNKLAGFHPERSMPLLEKETLRRWLKNRRQQPITGQRRVYFFCDEFTNYLDVSIGKKAILLLEKLGYTVIVPDHEESGRTFLSKGLVKKAAAIANRNIAALSPLLTKETPLVGIEPSAVLSLRDEYKDLATESHREQAMHLASLTFTIEEFIYQEIKKGHIKKEQFTKEPLTIVLHTHCYQKVLSSSKYGLFVLGFPENYRVQEIPSGCCGMAGSFGYEAEHFAVSQQVGELVLFPYLRKLGEEATVAAAGTSCRHQVKDGVNKKALHPVEILFSAING